MRFFRLFFAFLLGCLVCVPLAATAQAPAAPAITYQRLAPVVVSRVQFAASFPEDSTIQLPYNVLDSQPAAPIFVAPRWLFLAYVVDAGEKNGLWGFEYVPGEPMARAVQQYSQGDASGPPITRAVTPIRKFCSTQGDQVQAPDGAAYVWCVPQNRSNTMRIIRR